MREKDIQRKQMIEKRSKISPEFKNVNSLIIAQKILALDEYKKAENIFVYLSFGKEVDTSELIRMMKNDRKNIFVPYTEKNTNDMYPSRYNSPADLEVSEMGFPEPVKERLDIADFSEIDMVIVPGSVFDLEFNRIGFGKGYYDKYFSISPEKTVKCALAFDFQIKEKISVEEHDVKMDIIVTEKRVLKKK